MEPTPAELIALATEIEKEGQYNGAKLLRAAAESLVTRSSTTVDVPSEPADQARKLQELAERLEGSAAAALSDPLRATAEAVLKATVPLYIETPDPHVCRICGATDLQPFSGRCEHCGRWQGAEHRHRPIYWIRASTPSEAMELLASTPSTIASILEAGTADVPGPDGGWTAHQTLEHLHNAQSIFRGRIDQLLQGGEPELASVMVWKMGADQLSTSELLDQYRALRSEILHVLGQAEPDAWWNAGSHEEFGRVTLAEQTSYFANHEPTHLAQLADAAQIHT